MKKDNKNSYDARVHGERRRAPRREVDDRRGWLRWDPNKKERRTGRDRRQGARAISPDLGVGAPG